MFLLTSLAVASVVAVVVLSLNNLKNQLWNGFDGQLLQILYHLIHFYLRFGGQFFLHDLEQVCMQ